MPEATGQTGRHPVLVHVALALVAATVACAALILAGADLMLSLLAAWVVFCVVKLLTVAPLLGAGPPRSRAVALRDDETRALAGVLVLGGALASLVSVGVALHHHSSAAATTALAVVTVLVSWLLVHSEYMLRYARRWYLDGGGVTFPDGDDGGTLRDPDYRDFAYLALTLGMTYQVSDTDITSRGMRRLVTAHTLISYIFGAVILAVAVNAGASLIG